MKITKKTLCFILAFVVMISSFGLVSAFAADQSLNPATRLADNSGLTGDPEYFLKFDKNTVNSVEWLSNNDMLKLFDDANAKSGEFVKSDLKKGKITRKSNNSISIEKVSEVDGSDYTFSSTFEVPVTDEMRTNYLKAKNNTLYLSYYFSQANMAGGLYPDQFTNCQFRVYTKFKKSFKENDATGVERSRYIKHTSLPKDKGYQAYEQKINSEIQLLGSDNKPLSNLNDVQSIVFSVYSYSRNVKATLELSGITYAGVPEITPYKAPEPAGKKEYVSVTNWSKNYNKSFADTPATVLYSATGGYNADDYSTMTKVGSTTTGTTGWVYIKNMTDVTTKQINLFYNLDRDAFNKAIVTANQEGGSGKFVLTGKFPVILDTTGKPMAAELQVQIYTYNQGAYTPIQKFIKPGQEFRFDIDVSDLTVNSVDYLKIALMAFWKYDEKTDLFYDVDKAIKYDKNGNKLTAKYSDAGDFLGYDNGKSSSLLQEKDVAKITANCSNGKKNVDVTNIISRLTTRTMKNIEGFIAPMYVKTTDGSVPTTASTKATTKSTQATSDEYKYVGYHFYDFTPQAYAETYGWGTHASFVNYLQADYYDSYEIVDKNYEKDNMKQGYKDPKNPGKKVNGNKQYIKDYEEAKSLVSGGYQIELASPYPRVQQQHQAYFHITGADEDARLTNPDCGDHKNQKAQGEKYDFTTQMANALKYAKENPDPDKSGYLAIDVYAVDSVHGYKNEYNSTYKAWCKKNGKTATNEKSAIQVLVAIHANIMGEDISATALEFVPVGQKKTLYLDVSEIEVENITAVRVAAQNYANLANRQQGGQDEVCGITDVQLRLSSIYVPGNKNTDLVKTTDKTGVTNSADIAKIVKLYKALPGLSVDDYNTTEDYDKLAAFMKAWTDASIESQQYCTEKYGINYALISMLEYDVYNKLFLSGDSVSGSPATGEIAFPLASLLIAGAAGYVILRTRKKRQ